MANDSALETNAGNDINLDGALDVGGALDGTGGAGESDHEAIAHLLHFEAAMVADLLAD